MRLSFNGQTGAGVTVASNGASNETTDARVGGRQTLSLNEMD